MKKLFRKLFAVAVFLLALAGAGADTQAQWYPGPIKVWGPQWVYYGHGGYGYWVINHGPFGSFGGYYPGYYDIDLSRLSRRGRFTLGGAGLGGVIGVLAGGRKGAAIGAPVGAGVGWLVGGRRPDYRLPRHGQYDPRTGDYGADVFRIRNRSRYAVDVYDGDRFVFQLRPGTSVRVPRPYYHYRAFSLTPGYDGRLGERAVPLIATGSGWEVVY